jgi:glucose-6-phosphate dehydrogenase assembly protein OpcA
VAAAVSTTLDPRAIEREIGMIRERESNPYSSGIKTNLFNLVILSAPAGGDDPQAEALRYLLGRRPARIITLDRRALPDEGSQGVQAAVSGRCFPGTHSRGVCFEEIHLSGGGEAAADVGAWAPLLIRDIPVYAWALGPVTSDVLAALVEAAEYIDKLIVDSAAGIGEEEGMQAMRALAAARTASRRSVVVSDLAWRRTALLRAIAARLFDPPEARAHLTSLRSVSTRGLLPAESAQHLLWLAARLGWSARPDAHFLDAAGRQVSVSIEDAPTPSAARQREAGITFGFEESEPLQGSTALPSDGEVLLAEVDSLRQDPLLEEVLALAAQSPSGACGRALP